MRDRQLRRRLFFVAAFAALCLGVLVSESISALSTVAIQDQNKVFEKSPDPRPKPVELIELKSTNKVVKFGEKFKAAHDWLKGASFKVKNTSDKEMVYLELDLNFSETAYTGNEMSFPIKLGRRSAASIVFKEPLSIQPGSELVIRLDENKYEQLRKFIQTRQPISDINKVRVEIGFIIFADGTAWGSGSYYRQDPNNPNRYINIGDKPLSK